jgi:hypothetical protein
MTATTENTTADLKATRRALSIAGIRALCDWLEANPDTRMPNWDRVNIPLSTNAAVKAWADEHGALDLVKYDDEGNASVDYMFGAVAMHVYGYVDFAGHCDRNDGRTARRYADRHGLELVAAEPEAAR